MKRNSLILLLIISFASVISAQNFPNVRISASGGFSYFPVTEPSGELFIKNEAYNQYNRHLSWGKNVDGNAHYISNMGLGFGVKYRYLNVKAPSTDLFVDAGSEHYGVINLSEDNDIHFIAPSVMYMRWLGDTNKLLALTSLSIGYTDLTSRGNIDGTSLVMFGNNVGYQLDLGLDYFLTKKISVGFNTGYFYSKIKEVNMGLSETKTILPENSQLNLSNIKLNVSLALNF